MITLVRATARAAVLRAAADHLELVGLCKGAYYDHDEATRGVPPAKCPADLRGAINVAVCGYPVPPMWGLNAEKQELALVAVEDVRHHLDPDGAAALTAWNDNPQRTGEQVVAELRATADQLDHTDDAEDEATR